MRMTAQPTYENNHRQDLRGPARVADRTVITTVHHVHLPQKALELIPGQFLGSWATELANLSTNVRWGINE